MAGLANAKDIDNGTTIVANNTMVAVLMAKPPG
jgi:hypothetical protein